jgi:3-oxoacyl-[acyl-carrier protein] reductase
MDLRLGGKRAIVTGGSRGIGRAIALGLAAEGVAVAIGARDLDGVTATVTELHGYGVAAYGEAVDVTDPDALEAFVLSSADALGGLDLLVANAGALSGGPQLSAIDGTDWRYTLDINVTHPAIAARAAQPLMAANGGGAMLFMASIAGMHAWTRPHYGAAKAAEIHLASSLALALAGDGIRVNVISPGSIMFPGSNWERLAEDEEAFNRWLDHEFPFKRLGTDQEIADVACFLLSERASWVTGINVPVDGGQTAPNMLTTQPMAGAWANR